MCIISYFWLSISEHSSGALVLLGSGAEGPHLSKPFNRVFSFLSTYCHLGIYPFTTRPAQPGGLAQSCRSVSADRFGHAPDQRFTAALTIASIAARIAVGRSGQASMTACRSASIASFSVGNAPLFAPPVLESGVFSVFPRGVSSPLGGIGFVFFVLPKQAGTGALGRRFLLVSFLAFRLPLNCRASESAIRLQKPSLARAGSWAGANENPSSVTATPGRGGSSCPCRRG